MFDRRGTPCPWFLIWNLFVFRRFLYAYVLLSFIIEKKEYIMNMVKKEYIIMYKHNFTASHFIFLLFVNITHMMNFFFCYINSFFSCVLLEVAGSSNKTRIFKVKNSSSSKVINNCVLNLQQSHIIFTILQTVRKYNGFMYSYTES